MVSKMMRGRTRKRVSNLEEEEEEEESVESKTKNNVAVEIEKGYEKSREQRIKENMERMEKLGLLDLSRMLKPELPPRNPSHKRKLAKALPPSGSPRRSSRIKTMAPISYNEKVKQSPKEVKSVKNIKIHMKEGSKPEIYSEDHEKLLGDCKTTWTLYVDGYDEIGERIYDQFDGKSCHQCRQKTLGCHTGCSSCKSVQGQFCGDCLYIRYGENVVEANEDSDWTCPVCRDICNCSRCRRLKGWEPTGSIYKKVKVLGFRSVAHYLIQTRRPRTNSEEATGDYTVAEGEAGLSDVDSVSQSDESRGEEMDEDSDHDGDGAHNSHDDNSDNNEHCGVAATDEVAAKNI